jgi:hypothetical protein
MSFFSDLFEGNFNNLGNDITHAPSSLINHPDELAETLGGAALIGGGIAFAPEIAGALGIGEAGAIGAGAGVDAGLAADLGIADIGGAAAFDSAAGAADAGLIGGDALAFTPGFAGGDVLSLGGEADAFLPTTSDLASFDSGAAGFNPVGDTFASTDVAAPDSALPAGATVNDLPAAGGGAGTVPTGAGATTPPAGFASTDAELAGAATGTAPAATPAAGGGVTGALSSTLASPWTKLALAGAPLALALGMGQPSLPASAQQLQGQATALQQQGLTDLSQARAGVLNAGQTAVITQVKTDLTNQWRQTLFNQGVQDPSKDARWPQIEAAIDAQVTQQTAQLIQQNITNALAETGQASTALTSIAQMQFQADQNFTNSLINATKSLGLAAGLSSGTTIKVG